MITNTFLRSLYIPPRREDAKPFPGGIYNTESRRGHAKNHKVFFKSSEGAKRNSIGCSEAEPYDNTTSCITGATGEMITADDSMRRNMQNFFNLFFYIEYPHK